MIELSQVSKTFTKESILENINLSIPEGHIYGLIGTNGAGKSTLLRLMAGIYKPDRGNVILDNMTVFQNPKAKGQLFFIPDDLFFPTNANPLDMASYYQGIYPDFDRARYEKLLKAFSLPPKKAVKNMSKGMKRQVAILCGICSNTKYLYCDETFDGLDPIIRQSVKALLMKDLEERQLTPIIASHNLREQEDICEQIGILHHGKIVLSKDILEMKYQISKVEVCFETEEDAQACLAKLDIHDLVQKGPLYLFHAKGDREDVLSILKQANTTYLDLLPLTLQEIFIDEMEAIGYDIKKLILD